MKHLYQSKTSESALIKSAFVWHRMERIMHEKQYYMQKEVKYFPYSKNSQNNCGLFRYDHKNYKLARILEKSSRIFFRFTILG